MAKTSIFDLVLLYLQCYLIQSKTNAYYFASHIQKKI